MKKILVEDDGGRLISVDTLLDFMREIKKRHGEGYVKLILEEIKSNKEMKNDRIAEIKDFDTPLSELYNLPSLKQQQFVKLYKDYFRGLYSHKGEIPDRVAKVLIEGIICPRLMGIDGYELEDIANKCQRFKLLETNAENLTKEFNRVKDKYNPKAIIVYLVADSGVRLDEFENEPYSSISKFAKDKNIQFIIGAKAVRTRKKMRKIILILAY